MSAADCTLTYIFLAAALSSRLNKNKEKNIIALQKKWCTESVTAIMSDYEFPFYRAASEVSRWDMFDVLVFNQTVGWMRDGDVSLPGMEG